MSSEIFSGIAKALKHPPNRHYIAGVLASCTSLNQSDARGVFLLLLKMNPAASPQQRETTVLLLQHLSRLGVFTNYPDECGLMKSRVDEILLQALADPPCSAPVCPPLGLVEPLSCKVSSYT